MRDPTTQLAEVLTAAARGRGVASVSIVEAAGAEPRAFWIPESTEEPAPAAGREHPPSLELLRLRVYSRGMRKNARDLARPRARRLRFRAVFKADGKWLLGSSPDVPGAFSQERTLRQARASLEEAVRDLVELDPRLAKKLAVKDESVSETLTIRA